MKRIIISLAGIMLVALAFGQVNIKAEDIRLSPRLLNYQGFLTDTLNNPINDSLDITFRIYDAASAGNIIWYETQFEVPVLKGIFHVLLGSTTTIPDSVFTKSTGRWLELRISSQNLSPRTRIVSAPYAYTAAYSDTALYALAAPMTGAAGGDLTGSYPNPAIASNAVNSAKILDGSIISSDLRDTTIVASKIKDAAVTMPKIDQAGAGPGQVIKWNGTAWQPDVDFIGSDNDWAYLISDVADTTLCTGGRWGLARLGNTLYGNADSTHVNFGVACTTGTSGQNYKYATVGGGNQNAAVNYSSTVAGGIGNSARGIQSTVSGGTGNTAVDTRTTVAGGGMNTASVLEATVGGGANNTASGIHATVGGGYYNLAAAFHSTVGGGFGDTTSGYAGGVFAGVSNLAGDGADDSTAVVGGGYNNSALAKYTFAGGGANNTVGSNYSLVVGGDSNSVVTQNHAIIVGGRHNYNAGPNSFLGGGQYNSVTSNRGIIVGGYADTVLSAGSFIGGGYANKAFTNIGYGYQTIGGGEHNSASGEDASITGGYGNFAGCEGIDSRYQTIGGGSCDTAKAYAGGVFCGYSNIAGDTVYDSCAAVCGGYNNSALAKYAFVGGGMYNTAGYYYNIVVGGDSNTATAQNNATIVGGHRNYNSAPNSFLGGGQLNYIAGGGGVIGGGNSDSILSGSAFIGGGYGNKTFTNIGYGYQTIGGGNRNAASGQYAAITGGFGNYAGCEGVNSYCQTIGGGMCDTAKGFAGGVFCGYSNIAGDTVYDTSAVVSGGWNNSALAKYSCVPGGRDNSAAGIYTFAAGRRAKANNQGCFVWADATDADMIASADNRWVARCSGGVYFYTNAAMTTGVYAAAGSGTWSSISDRDLKENFKPVDGAEVLNKLAAMPITTWNYKSQDPSIRHIGPMAQDFAGFGIGEDDKHITTIDADGIALAAIQELNKKLEKLETENRELRRRIEILEGGR